MHIKHSLNHFGNEFRAAARAGKFTRQDDGGILLLSGVRLHGVYVEGIAGQPESFRTHNNLIPAAGILHILDVVLGATAKNAAWYIAPFASATTPASNLTAASFTATQSEITSGTEGYTQSTRVAWTPAVASAGAITNAASLAAFTIITASALNITGAGLLSASAKGSTAGVLISAAKYGSTRVLNNADVWNAQYSVSLTDS